MWSRSRAPLKSSPVSGAPVGFAWPEAPATSSVQQMPSVPMCHVRPFHSSDGKSVQLVTPLRWLITQSAIMPVPLALKVLIIEISWASVPNEELWLVNQYWGM